METVFQTEIENLLLAVLGISNQWKHMLEVQRTKTERESEVTCLEIAPDLIYGGTNQGDCQMNPFFPRSFGWRCADITDLKERLKQSF